MNWIKQVNENMNVNCQQLNNQLSSKSAFECVTICVYTCIWYLEIKYKQNKQTSNTGGKKEEKTVKLNLKNSMKFTMISVSVLL